MFYVEDIRGLIFTMFTHKKLEIVFVFVQRSGSGNLLMDFLAFIEQTWKENNTYFIDVLIIDNVELWNLKSFVMRLFYVEKIRFVMFTLFSHKKLETVSVFVINGFVYCSIFVY